MSARSWLPFVAWPFAAAFGCGSNASREATAPSPLPASAAASVATTASPPPASAAVDAPPPPPGSFVDKVVFTSKTTLRPGRLTLDDRGNRYVLGAFGGSVTFGDLPPITAQGEDTFLLKLDPKNKPLWVKRFGGSDVDDPLDIAIDDAGSVYVSLTFQSTTIDVEAGVLRNIGAHDLLLMKLDADGKVAWAKRYGDAMEQTAMRLHAYPGGGVVATGWFEGAIDFGGAFVTSPWQRAFYVARIDANGKAVFAKPFGQRTEIDESDVAVDAKGEIVVTGGSNPSPDFQKGAIGSADDDLGPVLVRLSQDGKIIDARRFGLGGASLTTGVAVDPKNGVRFAVASTGATSFDGDARRPQPGFASLVVAAFDGAGAFRWKREVFASRVITIHASAVAPTGDFYVAGLYSEEDPARGSRDDGFLVKLTTTGEIDWTTKIAEGASADVMGLAIDATGHPVVTAALVGNGNDFEMWIGTVVR